MAKYPSFNYVLESSYIHTYIHTYILIYLFTYSLSYVAARQHKWRARCHLFCLNGACNNSIGHDERQIGMVDGSRVDLVSDGALQSRHHLTSVSCRTDSIQSGWADRSTVLGALRHQLNGVFDNQLRENCGHWRHTADCTTTSQHSTLTHSTSIATARGFREGFVKSPPKKIPRSDFDDVPSLFYFVAFEMQLLPPAYI